LGGLSTELSTENVGEVFAVNDELSHASAKRVAMNKERPED
jgi:hypothetical protein